MDLLERVKGAEGADEALDMALWNALMPAGRFEWHRSKFTASLDAALALVERCKPDWAGLISLEIAGSAQAHIEARDPCDRRAAQAFGHTPALALLSALLTALLSQEEDA